MKCSTIVRTPKSIFTITILDVAEGVLAREWFWVSVLVWNLVSKSVQTQLDSDASRIVPLFFCQHALTPCPTLLYHYLAAFPIMLLSCVCRHLWKLAHDVVLLYLEAGTWALLSCGLCSSVLASVFSHVFLAWPIVMVSQAWGLFLRTLLHLSFFRLRWIGLGSEGR